MITLTRMLAGVLRRSPTVTLRVTDDEGRVLVDAANAGRDDYRLSVALLNGPVIVDLYGHYLRFVDTGGKAAYRGTDAASRTYVKFGECIQDKRELHILIEPSS
ncbi:hypothetical protein [Noviherbaspirillum autotrophicum]|uniref:Uncharacterized protein n=1 Tax=Noviherbaspirillum autotrophicum TaxID=709839 RepID=A0A0C2C1D5_9BURK|nr:hypothetical protein [Noviherbaspirillum autotrophicum]KIF81698.1 hypothetical protein TSA66_14310 [Noviherbaspirillum autotrophicum]KIF82065.1 hypothetical protein TSA66_16675 [Noviherbaspirillum autotrophicum]KIF84141.1 hypothetical protein TSA66_00345 [Noviherbaspirillum autotrophicum]